MLLDVDENIKLADFGSSQEFYMDEDSILSHKGTIYYLAPECFKSSGGGTKFYSGKAADIWALGMTLFTVVFNELPFVPAEEGKDPREQIQNINWAEWLPEAYSQEQKLSSQISTIRETDEPDEAISPSQKPHSGD